MISLDNLNTISVVTLEIFPASHRDKIIEFWVLASHRERIEFAIYFSSEPVRDKAVEGKVKLLNYFGFHPKISLIKKVGDKG